MRVEVVDLVGVSLDLGLVSGGYSGAGESATYTQIVKLVLVVAPDGVEEVVLLAEDADGLVGVVGNGGGACISFLGVSSHIGVLLRG